MPVRAITILRLTLCDPLVLYTLCGLAAGLVVLGLAALAVEEVLREGDGEVDRL